MEPLRIRAGGNAAKLFAMKRWMQIGFGAGLVTLGLVFSGPVRAQQSGDRQALKADAPQAKRNLRLILKDGSYQRVRAYKIEGERVRYVSSERDGEWEELPTALVDWPATRQWEQAGEETSPAMKEAQAIDKEELDERADQKARSPEVAPGLTLPDEEGVFALDRYEDKPELVELVSSDLNANQKTRRGVGLLNPLSALKMNLELDGAHARVQLHTSEPVLYLSLAGRDEAEPVLTHAFTVDTSKAKAENGKHGAQSADAGFALVRLDERRAVRVVGAIHLGLNGKVTQSENVIPTRVEVLEGKHWLRIAPAAKLAVGEYALVEILSPEAMNQSVWDFRIDPAAGRNPGSLMPIIPTKEPR